MLNFHFVRALTVHASALRVVVVVVAAVAVYHPLPLFPLCNCFRIFLCAYMCVCLCVCVCDCKLCVRESLQMYAAYVHEEEAPLMFNGVVNFGCYVIGNYLLLQSCTQSYKRNSVKTTKLVPISLMMLYFYLYKTTVSKLPRISKHICSLFVRLKSFIGLSPDCAPT